MSYIQATPLFLILGFFLLLPIVMIAVVSFWDYDFAQMYPGFVTFNYTETLGSRVTWQTYINTLKFAAIVWAITLFCGFGSLISSLFISAPPPCRWFCSSSAPCLS